MKKINKDILEQYERDGLITTRPFHTNQSLLICNYTPKVQYERLWDDVTTQCRGLVYDTEYDQIVARPFQKFFNMEELDEVPTNQNFKIYEKFDGSLGILFYTRGHWHFCTRGSSESYQAYKGREILKNKYSNHLQKLDTAYTYLFEIIYDENKIVVEYTDEKLVLLAIIKTDDVSEIDDLSIWPDHAFPLNEIFSEVDSFKFLKDLNIDNQEGYVIKYPNNFRFKIKFEKYVELHRIVCGLSNKAIWELLKAHGYDYVINEYLPSIPDELYDSVKSFIDDKNYKYLTLNSYLHVIYDRLSADVNVNNRKDFALKVKDWFSDTPQHCKIMFAMLDGRDYSGMIWDLIKPTYKKIS